MDPARRAAHDLLVEVREDGAYANLVWPAILDHRGVAGRDAAFATELGYGTLRWLGRHDAILAACVDRPLTELDPGLWDALRIGVHQLHNMRVAAHAAVSETVELVSLVVHPGAARLANAVLRRVAAGGSAEQWLARLVDAGAVPDPGRDPLGHLAVAMSHPRWIVAALRDALDDPGEIAALLAADNAAAGVTLAARAVSREDLLARLEAQGIPATPGRLSRLAVAISAVRPGSIPEVATGLAGVQDEGSQVVALALADAPLEGSDGRWLDLCAGPGGKAALLAGQVSARGGSLVAVELHEHRAALVRNALRPVQGRHEVVCADALEAGLEDRIGTGFDRVLLDAPCTGLGALRRRPESRWRRQEADLAELVDLQSRLLTRALELVRPGGLVMYVTCSPHLDETEGVVAGALRDAGPPASVVACGGPGTSRRDPYVRTWPHRDGTDGMFAALLRRQG